MNLTCLIRPTGRVDRSDDRSHDTTVGPTGRAGQLDRVNAALEILDGC